MKVLWVSPAGSGATIAERIREAGHQIVVYGEGAGLPLIKQPDLWTFAKNSDLIVVDGSFPVVRTRRSFRPHQDALFFDELRRQYGVKALGPTPTIDLLVGDKRYFRKWCQKLNIPHGSVEGEPWSSGAFFKGSEIVPVGPYLESWKPIFKSIGFRGWFELVGTITADGPIIERANASWPWHAMPPGREAEFVKELAR